MVFEDHYKKSCFLKMACFFFPKKLGKKHIFFIVDKTKQKLLFENYECFSKKEKKMSRNYFCYRHSNGPPMGTSTARTSLVLIIPI